MRSTSATGTQSYRERLPAPQLRRYVSCVWIQRVAAGRPAHEHRTVPNGCVEISCDLGSAILGLIGPQRAPVVATLAPGATVVGIRFRPGIAPAVLRIPAAELTDVCVQLDQLWVPATVLGERLCEAVSPKQAAALLEEAVAAKCAVAPAPDPLVAQAVGQLQPWRWGSVDKLTSELLVSPRQLRRRFVAAFGYGPKALQRILRFQAFLALTTTLGNGGGGLARLAADAGYADQAHLSRECSRLTGLSPKAFLAELDRSCRASHDHAASFFGLTRALLAGRASYHAASEIPYRR